MNKINVKHILLVKVAIDISKYLLSCESEIETRAPIAKNYTIESQVPGKNGLVIREANL